MRNTNRRKNTRTGKINEVQKEVPVVEHKKEKIEFPFYTKSIPKDKSSFDPEKYFKIVAENDCIEIAIISEHYIVISAVKNPYTIAEASKQHASNQKEFTLIYNSVMSKIKQMFEKK